MSLLSVISAHSARIRMRPAKPLKAPRGTDSRIDCKESKEIRTQLVAQIFRTRRELENVRNKRVSFEPLKRETFYQLIGRVCEVDVRSLLLAASTFDA